jgi:hypothetical protein
MMNHSSDSMTCDRFTDRLMPYLERETDDATRVAIERHAVTCGDCGSLLADLRKLRVDSANLPELAPGRDLWEGIAARIEAPVVAIGGDRASRPAHPATVRRAWLRRALLAASLVGAAGVGYLARGGGAPLVFPREMGEDVAALPSADTQLLVTAPEGGPAGTPAMTAPTTEVAATPRSSAIPSANAPAAASAPVRPLEVQLAVATLTADYDREIARLRLLIEQRRNQLDPVTVAIIEKNLVVIDSAITQSKKAIVDDPASGFLIESLNHSLQTKVELMRTVAMLPSST